MEKIAIILRGTIFILIITCFSNCTEMDYTYKEFLKGGEINYAGKADSVNVRAGNERLELSWMILSDPKINSYTIYWNNKLDSLKGSIIRKNDIDTINIIIPQLKEDVYHFSIVHTDKYGNKSIPTTTVGRTYGSIYKMFLLQKAYTAVLRRGSELLIRWNTGSSIDSSLVVLDFEYLNNKNVRIQKKSSGYEDISVLNDFPVSGGTFRYRSGYIPETNALDTFYTDFSKYINSSGGIID